MGSPTKGGATTCADYPIQRESADRFPLFYSDRRHCVLGKTFCSRTFARPPDKGQLFPGENNHREKSPRHRPTWGPEEKKIGYSFFFFCRRLTLHVTCLHTPATSAGAPPGAWKRWKGNFKGGKRNFPLCTSTICMIYVEELNVSTDVSLQKFLFKTPKVYRRNFPSSFFIQTPGYFIPRKCDPSAFPKFKSRVIYPRFFTRILSHSVKSTVSSITGIGILKKWKIYIFFFFFFFSLTCAPQVTMMKARGTVPILPSYTQTLSAFNRFIFYSKHPS